MKVTTVRLPESLYEDLEDEARGRDLSVSEYIRDVLRDREHTQANTPANTQANTLANTDLAERVDELAGRLEAVEDALQERTGPGADTSDSEGASSGVTPPERDEPHTPDELVPETGADSVATESTADAGASETVPDDVRRAVDVDELPSTVDTEAALLTIAAARDFIREREAASMREIVTGVMPRHSLGYDVPELEEGDRYRGSWWRKVVKPGLGALEDVEQPPGGQPWRWIGDEQAEGDVYDPTDEF